MDATHLGDQHGLCVSIANKTAVVHGGENFGHYNALHFSAPPRIQRLVQAGAKPDLGFWVMFLGEVIVKLLPRLTIIFNSGAGHACIPSSHLLPWANDHLRLAVEATRFAKEQTEAALADVRADPKLMEGFSDENRAAEFHSSLVGATTFQSAPVLNSLLRAAAASQPEAVLYERRSKASRRRAAAATATPPLLPPHPLLSVPSAPHTNHPSHQPPFTSAAPHPSQPTAPHPTA